MKSHSYNFASARQVGCIEFRQISGFVSFGQGEETNPPETSQMGPNSSVDTHSDAPCSVLNASFPRTCSPSSPAGEACGFNTAG